MNETHLRDFDDQLDRAIDALNRESSPAPYERGDRELFSLVDTARLMKSLRDPARPESGFAALTVDRLVRELAPRQPSRASDNGMLPASITTTSRVDAPGGGRSHPSRIRGWMREVSELAAILLLFALVLGGIAIYQSVNSGNDEAAIGGTDLSGDFDVYITDGQSTGPRTLLPIDNETLLDREDVPKSELSSTYSLSPDGSTMVRIEYARETGFGDEPLSADEVTVVVQNGLTGPERVRFHPPEYVGWPILSNDGTRLVTQSRLEPGGSEPPRWHVFDTRNGDLAGTIERDSRIGSDTLFFNADATTLIRAWIAPASSTGTPEPLRIMAYDIASGDEINRVELTDIPAGAWNLDPNAGTPMTDLTADLLIPAIVISPDGKQIAVAHADTQTVTLVDAESLTVERTIQLAGSGAEGIPWVERETNSIAGQMREHTEMHAQFSPDGRLLYVHGSAMGADDSTGALAQGLGLTLIDLKQGAMLARVHEGEQIFATPAPDGRSIYVTMLSQTDGTRQILQRLDAHTLDILAEREFDRFHQIVIDPPARDRVEDRVTTDPTQPAPESTPTTASEPELTPALAGPPVDEGMASILARFEETQADVDFDLAMPAQLDGFELPENGLSVSGPAASPGVNATFIDNNSSPPRMLGFAQRPDSFGVDFSREGDEAVTVSIQGVETTLYREPREGELPTLLVRWEMNGVNYEAGATNVEEETLLEILNSIAILSEIDATGETTAPTPETDVQLQDPVEFVLAYLQAMEERDMEAMRSMLVEPFREFDDDLLYQHPHILGDTDPGQDSNDWTVEYGEHFTVVRLNELPAVTYVLRQREGGTWLVDPGSSAYWWALRSTNDDFDDFGGLVEGIQVERISDTVDLMVLQQLIDIHLDLVEIDNNAINVTVQWMLTRSRSGDVPLDGLSWSSGDLRGEVEVTWATARLTQDTMDFPGLLPGSDGSLLYQTTFTLLNTPDSGDLQLHVPDITVIDENGDPITFSINFHFPNENYPQPRRESDP